MSSRNVNMKKKNMNLMQLKKIKVKPTKLKGRISVDQLMEMSVALGKMPVPAQSALPSLNQSKSCPLPPLGALRSTSMTATVLANKLHQVPMDRSPRKRMGDESGYASGYASDLDSGQNSHRSLVLSSRNLDGWDVGSACGSLSSMDSMGSAGSSTKILPASSKKVYRVFESSDAVNAAPVERTVREMVTDIEKRAKNHLRRPLYLPTMDELPSSVTSWNGNSLETLGTATSNIDIMPCHQTLELVLVLADERARKRTALLEQRNKLIEEKRKKLENGIYEKFNRVQMFQADICNKNLLASWARIIFIADYAEKYAEKYRDVLKSKRSFFQEFRAAMLVKKQMLAWKNKVVQGRYSLFFSMMTGKNWRMAMQVRILHKRMSIRRITDFLTICKGQKQLSTVVHSFLRRVRQCQRNCLAFLACKKARVVALCKMWDKLERRYILSVLNRKKDMAKQEVSNETVAILNLDPEMQIRMKNADKRWERIDARVDHQLKKLRFQGDIGNVSDDNDILKFMIRDKIKQRVILNLLENSRKEHLLERLELKKSQQHAENDFTVADVMSLLAGRELRKADPTCRLKILHVPFMLFRKNKDHKKHLFEFIKSHHEKHRTFAVYARQASTSRMLHVPFRSDDADDVNSSDSEDDGCGPTRAPFLQR